MKTLPPTPTFLAHEKASTGNIRYIRFFEIPPGYFVAGTNYQSILEPKRSKKQK
jgi:hypothetical protein